MATDQQAPPLSIDYGALMREALRGVLRGALEQVSREGLAAPHHFVIALATTAPGVEMSPALRARHPTAITIVLEHRFADLEVDAKGFAVTLWFSGVAERMRVPFAAVAGWADPGAGVSLQIGVTRDDEVAEPAGPAPEMAPPPPDAPPTGSAGETSNVIRFARPARSSARSSEPPAEPSDPAGG